MHTSQKTDAMLDFTLRIIASEKSKDSHSTIQTWRVKDQTLTYTKVHKGRGQDKAPTNITKQLTDEQIGELRELIDESLRQNIEMPKHTEFQAPYSAIHCTWDLHWENQTFKIELYELAKNITEDRTYQKLKQIASILK